MWDKCCLLQASFRPQPRELSTNLAVHSPRSGIHLGVCGIQFPFPSLRPIGQEQRVFLCLQPRPRGTLTSRFPPPPPLPAQPRGWENDLESTRGPGARESPCCCAGKAKFGKRDFSCIARPGWAAPSPRESAKQITSVAWARRLFLPSPSPPREKSHRARQQELIQATGARSLQKMGLGGMMEEGLQSRACCWPAELWL